MPLHGQDWTHEAQKIILLIYVDSYFIFWYACAHTSAHRIAHTHPNERTKRICEWTKRASEPSELNESYESYYWMKWISLRIKLSQTNQTIVKIQNVNRYKSLHCCGYQIGVGINKTSTTNHIGYYAITNDVLNHIGYTRNTNTILRTTNRTWADSIRWTDK